MAKYAHTFQTFETCDDVCLVTYQIQFEINYVSFVLVFINSLLAY